MTPPGCPARSLIVRTLTATVALLCLLAVPAQAANPRPRVLDAEFPAATAPVSMAELSFDGRDRNGVVRGYVVDFGDGSRTSISHCEARASRRGRRVSFEIPYAYLAAGTYTITIRVLSGGCNGERRQRSRPVTLPVTVG